MAVGSDLPSSGNARCFAHNLPAAWFAAGIHPHEAFTFAGDLAPFKAFADDERFAAVGEIGLDYYYENSDRTVQKKTFQALLALSQELGVPAIIHCRDRAGKDEAYDELNAILKDTLVGDSRFVLHCFAGNRHWLDKFLCLGAHIGITGIITFPKADNIREVVRLVPLDRLLLETDSPYLAPVPHRGKQNHPKYLLEIAESVAAEKSMNLEELVRQTTSNAFRFFNICEPDEES